MAPVTGIRPLPLHSPSPLTPGRLENDWNLAGPGKQIPVKLVPEPYQSRARSGFELVSFGVAVGLETPALRAPVQQQVITITIRRQHIQCLLHPVHD